MPKRIGTFTGTDRTPRYIRDKNEAIHGKTIKEIRRKVSFERLKEIVQRIHAGKNIHQHLDLIAGLPFEGLERFKQSFNDVYGLKPEQFQLGFLKVLKGSYMREKRRIMT